MDDERRKKIFAPVIKVGGITKPLKSKTSTNNSYASTMDAIKGDLTPTILKTFTYRDGDQIYNYENAKIQSVNRGKKHVCFMVTGEPKVMTQEEAIKAMPDDIGNTLRNFKQDEDSVSKTVENVD